MSQELPRPPSSDERMWALLAHLSIFVFSILGPLVIWLVKKEESPFVADQAKEALNFQLAVTITSVVCVATCVLAPAVIVVAIGSIVYAIQAAVDANAGRWYRYPYTIRMIS